LASCVLWLSMLGWRYLPWSSAALYIYTSPSWKQIVLNAKQPLCPSRQSISQQQRDAALARPRRATHTDNQHAREYRYGDVCSPPTSASGASYYSLPTWVPLHRVSHQLIAVASMPPTDPPTRPIRSSSPTAAAAPAAATMMQPQHSKGHAVATAATCEPWRPSCQQQATARRP
jgi:hypothetical protein